MLPNEDIEKQNDLRESRQFVLKPWDWRYRVGFDPQLASVIQEQVASVPDTRQLGVLRTILDWSQSFVSIEAIFECARTDGAFVRFCEQASAKKVLALREKDANFYLERVKRRYGGNASAQKALTRLLDAGVGNRFENLESQFFEVVFGNPTLRQLTAQPTELASLSDDYGELVSHDEFEPLVHRLVDDAIANCASHPEIHTQLDEMGVEIVDGEGLYAEYWPRELNNSKQDLLRVFRNSLSSNTAAIEGTIRHELYPGHGLFYGLLRKLSPSVVDHGASVLIEGWATFADWSGGSEQYRNFQLSRARRYSHLIDATSLEDLESRLIVARTGANQLPAIDLQMRQYVQYQSYSLSYLLGGLWFEANAWKSDPIGFLRSYLSHGAGDFFVLWNN